MIESPLSALQSLMLDAEASRDFSEFLFALNRMWPATTAESGADVRALYDQLPEQEWARDPWLIAGYAASYRSIGTSSRSAALPYFAAALGAMTDATMPAVTVGVLLHHAAALRSLGRFADALQCTTEAAELTTADKTLPLSWRLPMQAKAALQTGIALFHLGDYDSAVSELRVADGLAGGHLHRSERVECLGVLAMLHYTMGNFERSLESVEAARAASGDSGLLESHFGSGALIAELLVAVEQNRLEDALVLAPIVRIASKRSDWEPLGHCASAAVSIISGRHVEGLDLLRECLQSYREWQPPGSIAMISETLRAILMLRLGSVGAAWDILSSLHPTQHHACCPARFLAHLRLVTGDPKGAIAELRDCGLIGDNHSSRTLVDVLFIRAAAAWELGAGFRAPVDFDRALILAARTHMRIPFRLIPDTVMRALVSDARNRPQPESVLAMLTDIQGSTAVQPQSIQLSERERDIVRSLTNHRTVGQIADDLFISINTVKTHLKSVYRKMGVNTRSDAIRRARDLGLHVGITLE